MEHEFVIFPNHIGICWDDDPIWRTPWFFRGVVQPAISIRYYNHKQGSQWWSHSPYFPYLFLHGESCSPQMLTREWWWRVALLSWWGEALVKQTQRFLVLVIFDTDGIIEVSHWNGIAVTNMVPIDVIPLYPINIPDPRYDQYITHAYLVGDCWLHIPMIFQW